MILADYKFTIGSDRELFTLDSKPLPWTGVVSMILCLMSANDANFFDWMFEIGIVNAIGAMILSIIINCHGSAIFIRTWRFNFGMQYADIFEDTFGGGKILIHFAYIITLVYTSLSTMQSINNTLKMLVSHGKSDDSLLTNKYIVYYVIVPVFIVPFIFISKFSKFRFYFLFGNIGLLLVLITSIYFFVKSLQNDGFDPQKKLTIFGKDIWGTIDAYSSWSVLFWAQPFLCSVAKFMPKTKQRDTMNVIIISTVICAVINLGIALFAHFQFWGKAGTDDFLGLLERKNPMTIIGQFGSLMNLLISNCGYVTLAARELINIFFKDVTPEALFFSIFIIVLLCIVLIDYYDGEFQYYIDIVGKIAYLFMALILPPILYLNAFHLKQVWSYISIVDLIIACALTGFIIKLHVQ